MVVFGRRRRRGDWREKICYMFEWSWEILCEFWCELFEGGIDLFVFVMNVDVFEIFDDVVRDVGGFELASKVVEFVCSFVFGDESDFR